MWRYGWTSVGCWIICVSLMYSMKFGLDWRISRATLPSARQICLMNRRNHPVSFWRRIKHHKTLFWIFQWDDLISINIHWISCYLLCVFKGRAARTDWVTFCPPCPTWLSSGAAFARWQGNCRAWPVTSCPTYRCVLCRFSACDCVFIITRVFSLQDRYNTWDLSGMDVTNTTDEFQWWMEVHKCITISRKQLVCPPNDPSYCFNPLLWHFGTFSQFGHLGQYILCSAVYIGIIYSVGVVVFHFSWLYKDEENVTFALTSLEDQNLLRPKCWRSFTVFFRYFTHGIKSQWWSELMKCNSDENRSCPQPMKKKNIFIHWSELFNVCHIKELYKWPLTLFCKP